MMMTNRYRGGKLCSGKEKVYALYVKQVRKHMNWTSVRTFAPIFMLTAETNAAVMFRLILPKMKRKV